MLTLATRKSAKKMLYNSPSECIMYLSQRLASDSEDRADERQMPERRRVTSHKAQAEPDRVRANINTGKNAEILKKCETLRQYSRFVEIVRSYGHIDQLTSAAMVQIMAQCQEENVLTEFMEHYGTELIEMLFKELTREEDLEISRLDGYDAGVKDGEKSGERKAALDIAKGMKRKKLDSSVITELTGLSLAEIESL